MSIFKQRCMKAQDLMAETGVDYIFVGYGSDMKYLIDYAGIGSERLVLLVLPADGMPSFITPALEVSRLELAGVDVFFDVLPWEEATKRDDPVEILSRIVDPAKQATIALTDQIWSLFVLQMIDTFPKANFVHATPVLGEMRMHKDAEEIEYLREAGRRADKVWEDCLKITGWIGSTELEIEQKVLGILKRHFAPPATSPPSCWGIWGGPNSSSPHGGGNPNRAFQPSDAVQCNLGGGSHMGYWTDKDRCVQIAPATEEYRKVYEVVREAQHAAIEAVRPGVTCENIDLTGRRVIEKAGYGEYFIHRIGHGLGLEVHEPPYMVLGNKRNLEPGMVFTVEPAVFLPGKFGVRIQDIVVVTEDGVEDFYRSTKELHIVQ